MPTAVVTDGKYRSSIAAVRALGRAGYQVIVTQTRGDCEKEPAVFSSQYASETVWIQGKATDADYPCRLSEILKQYQRPVLFCVGAQTLNMVSAHREEFSSFCDFLIAPQSVLDELNDKETVHRRAQELGIPAPRQYDGEPESYPVVIKPHCGEKFGLKAQDRYAIADDREEYMRVLEKMSRYDPQPIVQEKITGDGFGVSMLLDGESRLVCALCHRRIREYPVSGGPSTCCESVYDEKKIEQAYELLRSFGFVGLAMVEFKGDYILEVNPRVWGSFPMTEQAQSPMTARYAAAARGEELSYCPRDYKTGVRMRFLLNDTLAILGYLRKGPRGKGMAGIPDLLFGTEALAAKDDPKPFRRYLLGYLLRK